MFSYMFDHPVPLLGFVTVIALLCFCAMLRVRRDRRLKQRRALVDRRQPSRAGQERRWQPRPH